MFFIFVCRIGRSLFAWCFLICSKILKKLIINGWFRYTGWDNALFGCSSSAFCFVAFNYNYYMCIIEMLPFWFSLWSSYELIHCVLMAVIFIITSWQGLFLLKLDGWSVLKYCMNFLIPVHFCFLSAFFVLILMLDAVQWFILHFSVNNCCLFRKILLFTGFLVKQWLII